MTAATSMRITHLPQPRAALTGVTYGGHVFLVIGGFAASGGHSASSLVQALAFTH